jgi:hypothetical protein
MQPGTTPRGKARDSLKKPYSALRGLRGFIGNLRRTPILNLHSVALRVLDVKFLVLE